MKVVVFGATGMVGAGALLECCADPRVTEIVAIVRNATGRSHAKLREIIHADFYAYDALRAEFATTGACFFCIGVTSAGMDEATYTRFTYDLTMAAATAMAVANPRMTFCYVSGEGADSTEKGRVMWARVRGRLENALLALPFAGAYVFRPALIQPMKGVRSRTAWYHLFYTVTGPLYPLMRRLLPGYMTTTVNLGKALIEVAVNGFARRMLKSKDINTVAGA